jgi:hypothetical protein
VIFLIIAGGVRSAIEGVVAQFNLHISVATGIGDETDVYDASMFFYVLLFIPLNDTFFLSASLLSTKCLMYAVSGQGAASDAQIFYFGPPT